MTNASEQAAAFLNGGAPRERQGEARAATDDYARLRDLIAKDDLTDAENEEFETLAEKRRSGTLQGSPARTVFKRKSVSGERGEDDSSKRPSTASDIAAAQLLGRSL